MVALALILTILGGIGMAFQSPTTTTLANHIGNFEATVMNFAVGTLVLSVGTVLLGTGDITAAAGAPWWQFLGGVYGVIVILVITYVAPLLGIALTLTIIMLGQLIMGTVIDAFGLIQTEAVAIAPLRIVGCITVAAGIVMVYLGKEHQKGDARGITVVIACAVAFLSGASSAVQSPTNVALSLATGKFEASLISFISGLTFILIVTAIVRKGRLQKPEPGLKPWMFTGGLYGSSAIFINTIATPYLGVALLVASIMLGQLIGGIFVDKFGWFRARKIKETKLRLLGIAAIMAGVLMVTLARM